MIAIRVVGNRVVERFASDKASLEGQYHPDFIAMLHDAPDDVQPGWILQAGQWQPYAPPLSEIKRDLIDNLERILESRSYIFATASLAGVATNPGLNNAARNSLQDPAAVDAQDADNITRARDLMTALATTYGRPDGNTMARDLMAENDKYALRRTALQAHFDVGRAAIEQAADETTMRSAHADAMQNLEGVS